MKEKSELKCKEVVVSQHSTEKREAVCLNWRGARRGEGSPGSRSARSLGPLVSTYRGLSELGSRLFLEPPHEDPATWFQPCERWGRKVSKAKGHCDIIDLCHFKLLICGDLLLQQLTTILKKLFQIYHSTYTSLTELSSTKTPNYPQNGKRKLYSEWSLV